jgi:hypothetical protein
MHLWCQFAVPTTSCGANSLLAMQCIDRTGGHNTWQRHMTPANSNCHHHHHHHHHHHQTAIKRRPTLPCTQNPHMIKTRTRDTYGCCCTTSQCCWSDLVQSDSSTCAVQCNVTPEPTLNSLAMQCAACSLDIEQDGEVQQIQTATNKGRHSPCVQPHSSDAA